MLLYYCPSISFSNTYVRIFSGFYFITGNKKDKTIEELHRKNGLNSSIRHITTDVVLIDITQRSEFIQVYKLKINVVTQLQESYVSALLSFTAGMISQFVFIWLVNQPNLMTTEALKCSLKAKWQVPLKILCSWHSPF